MKEFRSERTPPKGGPVGQAWKGGTSAMTKVTELAIRAKVAVQYPGWRVDFVGPATVVMTNIMGHRRMVTFRRRKRHRDGPLMRAAK